MGVEKIKERVLTTENTEGTERKEEVLSADDADLRRLKKDKIFSHKEA
jgi:hypothetical protein